MATQRLHKKISVPSLYDNHTIEIPTGFTTNGRRIITKIDCSFGLEHHPELNQYLEYAYSQGCIANLYPNESQLKPKIIKSIEQSYFVQLAINTLPDCTDTSKLQDMVNWILLLFAFDNVIDNPVGKIPANPNTLKSYTKILSEAVQGYKRTVEDSLNVLKDAGVEPDEIEEALKPMRLASYFCHLPKSFHEEARRHFESSLFEMHNPKKMTLNSYLSIRRSSSAIDSVIRLAEGDLPDYFRKSEYFKQANSNIVDYIWGVNDLGGAKEFMSHEPSYLKIECRTRMEGMLNTLDYSNSENGSYSVLKQTNLAVLQAKVFERAIESLISSINDAHSQYLHTKQETLSSIEEGSIFNQTSVEEEYLNLSQDKQAEFREKIRQDFLSRCLIRERLAAAGNECTRVSSRYVDFNDPTKNFEVTGGWNF